MKLALRIHLFALGATTACAKLGSDIINRRSLVVADYRLKCGACGDGVANELTCELSDGTTTFSGVQCACPSDCPLGDFSCDVSSAGFTTDTSFEVTVALKDGSDSGGHCKYNAGTATTSCGLTCPAERKLICGTCTGTPQETVSCKLGDESGVVNTVECECPADGVCPSSISCAADGPVPAGDFPVFFDDGKIDYGTCKPNPSDDNVVLCSGNKESCPPAKVICSDCNAGTNTKSCKIVESDGTVTNFSCSCSNCADDVCDFTAIDLTTFGSGITYPDGCRFPLSRDELTCPGECTTNSPTAGHTPPPTQPPTSPPTEQPTSPPRDQPTSPPTHAPTSPPTNPTVCVADCDRDTGVGTCCGNKTCKAVKPGRFRCKR